MGMSGEYCIRFGAVDCIPLTVAVSTTTFVFAYVVTVLVLLLEW